jgi:hypothetical protein
MSARNEKLERLLRSAAAAGEEKVATEAPFGFDTRVVALWRAGANKPNGLAGLLRRVTLLSAAVLVISTGAVFWEVQQSRDLSDLSSNEFAIADSVIQNEFTK